MAFPPMSCSRSRQPAGVGLCRELHGLVKTKTFFHAGGLRPQPQPPPPAPAAPERDTREHAITFRRSRFVNLPERGYDWRTTISPRTAPVCNKTSKVR